MENYNENFDNFIDKSLVFFERPIDKLLNRTISLYHGSLEDIHGDIKPMGPNVGATKFSKPRWSCYYWDDYYKAAEWAIAWSVQKYAEIGVMYPMVPSHGDKLLLRNKENIDIETLKQDIANKNITAYVYEVRVKANDIEIGSCSSIREYTLSKTVPVYKKHKIFITKNIIDKYFRVVSNEEWNKAKKERHIGNVKQVRGPILNKILNQNRDQYRRFIRHAVNDGLIQQGSDISAYKGFVNKAVKQDLLGSNKKENADMRNYNIDNELDTLLEGFIANFKKKQADKKAARNRENIMRYRRGITEQLQRMPEAFRRTSEYVKESVTNAIKYEDDSMDLFFDDYGWYVDDVRTLLAAKKISHLLRPEERKLIAVAINEYRKYDAKNLAMIKQGLTLYKNDKIKKDFEEAIEDYNKYVAFNVILKDVDGLIADEANEMKQKIDEYNKIMAEKQHPTDN